METLKKIFKKIGSILLTVILTIVAIFLLISKKSKNEKEEAEKIKKEKHDELEKKTADDIAADSPNPDTISSNIKREQEELRKRLRDRFNKDI